MAQRSHRCEEGGRRAARRLRRLHRADRVDEPRWLAQPPPTPTSSASSSSSPLPASLLARSSRRIRSRRCLLTAASTAWVPEMQLDVSPPCAARRAPHCLAPARTHRVVAAVECCCCTASAVCSRSTSACAAVERAASELRVRRLAALESTRSSQPRSPVAGCLRSSSTPKGNTTATSALSSTLGRGCKASHCPRCAST